MRRVRDNDGGSKGKTVRRMRPRVLVHSGEAVHWATHSGKTWPGYRTSMSLGLVRK